MEDSGEEAPPARPCGGRAPPSSLPALRRSGAAVPPPGHAAVERRRRGHHAWLARLREGLGRRGGARSGRSGGGGGLCCAAEGKLFGCLPNFTISFFFLLVKLGIFALKRYIFANIIFLFFCSFWVFLLFFVFLSFLASKGTPVVAEYPVYIPFSRRPSWTIPHSLARVSLPLGMVAAVDFVDHKIRDHRRVMCYSRSTTPLLHLCPTLLSGSDFLLVRTTGSSSSPIPRVGKGLRG